MKSELNATGPLFMYFFHKSCVMYNLELHVKQSSKLWDVKVSIARRKLRLQDVKIGIAILEFIFPKSGFILSSSLISVISNHNCEIYTY